MNQEKLSALADEVSINHDHHEGEDIPILQDTAADHDPIEDVVDELEVTLGYADLDEPNEQSPHADAEIATLSLDSVVYESEQERLKREQDIATLEAIVFAGSSPNQKSAITSKESTSFSTAQSDQGKSPVAKPEQRAEASEHTHADKQAHPDKHPDKEQQSATEYKVVIPPHIAAHSNPKPLPTTSNNPFLPQHILDRLNQGKRNLVEEIAQSGAALDASTAMLRARARPERLNDSAPAGSEQTPHTHHAPHTGDPKGSAENIRKQQLIDDLVEEYLPLLASELRKRLKALLDEVK